jgi:asparagine N-glycosylation enzyme membrane subunit Stt3
MAAARPKMHGRTTLLLAIFVVFLVQAAFALASQTPALNGQLTGPDAYMRLHRVMVLFETGNWYGAFNLRTNAPFGEQLHWTRPLDSILFAGTWIGSAVTDFPGALLAWGVIIGPATLFLLVPIWSWGTRTLLSPGAFILSLAVIAIMPLLNGVFLFGRPDHHGLLALSFLSVLAIFVRLATGQSRARSALVAGVITST